MEAVTRAGRAAELLSPKLLNAAEPGDAMGLGLEQTEFDGLLDHMLARLLSAHRALAGAVRRARSVPQDQEASWSVRAEMERALRKDPDKLDALLGLMEAAGGPTPEPRQDRHDEQPRGRHRRLRRRFTSILAPAGAVAAVLLMIGLAGMAIVGVEIASGETFLRWFSIVVLACLPGWLFLRFIVFRAGSLWTDYVLNLHRLGMDEHEYLPPPPMSSGYYRVWARKGGSILSGCPNVYQQKFEAYYGKLVGRNADHRRSVLDKSIPQVLLATAVMAVGWAAVLARQPLLSGPLVLPVDSLRFGFMGAYVFVLQMLIRRFFQTDLKASAYLGVVARIVTVVITVLVVHYAAAAVVSISAGTEVALSFLIGFFPLLGMQIVQKAVSLTFRRLVHTLKTAYPLSDLDGLNIWYEARLLEEGIEDMQNLVTGNLVDIILHTRVPVGRLVDWIDQAALQLLVDPPVTGQDQRPTCDRDKLRRLGIRTATDLETVFLPQNWLAAHSSRPAVRNINDTTLVKGVRRVLNRKELRGINVVEALLKSFSNTPNLVHVRHWREGCGLEHEQPAPTPSALRGSANGSGGRASNGGIGGNGGNGGIGKHPRPKLVPQ